MAMSAWTESYNQLSEAQQVNVQRWIHLNKFIARTLNVPEKQWFEDYIGECMAKPLDYGFMEVTIPGFSGIAVPGQGESFTTATDPSAVLGPRVALRAQNNLGKLSPDLQDQIARFLETGESDPVKLKPADVAQLQKMFSSVKALAKLKRPSFRKLTLARDLATDDMTLTVEGAEEIMRTNLMEFAAVMSRKLL